jgi:N-acetylmuramoyl-L-alanine amidase
MTVAAHISALLADCTLQSENAREAYELAVYAYYMLANNKDKYLLIYSAFNWRLLTIAGFTVQYDLSNPSYKGTGDKPDRFLLNIVGGVNSASNQNRSFDRLLETPSVKALNYFATCDLKRLFTSSADKKGDDYYAAPENKENDVVYDGIELTVCIDAAHGGFDKGTLGEDDRLEKNDTLKIAEALKEYLESCGVKVIMTRTDDRYISVEERCKIANDNGADLFVSIHRSSSEIEGSDTHAEQQCGHDARHKTDTLHGTLVLDRHAARLIAEGLDNHTCHSATKTHTYFQSHRNA